jgi:uncharacterized cupredoxin-like copper-binding protein
MVALTVALIGWMLAQVAEHPGVPREVGELPRWFAAEPAVHSARERFPAPVGAAPATHGHEAGVAISSINPGAPAARAPEKTDAAEGAYAEFAGGQIEIALLEYEMKPSKIRVKPGTVTFVLRNEGRFAHDFHVEGPGVDAYAAKFSPGRTVRLEVALPEGEYKISCPLSNHDQRGMHGTLIATAKLTGK